MGRIKVRPLGRLYGNDACDRDKREKREIANARRVKCSAVAEAAIVL